MLAKAVLFSSLMVIISAELSPARRFECFGDGRCQVLLPGVQTGFSFEHCRLICDLDGNLWPKVRSFSRRSTDTRFVDISGTILQLNFSSLNVPLLDRIIDVFKLNLQTYFGSKPTNINGQPLQVTIRNQLNADVRKVSLRVNESYSLSISCDSDSATAMLSAETVFGIRHALETLTQLIIYDDANRGIRVACDVEVQDSPAFPYRGLSMDTVRHWYPIETLKKLIDGMAMNKLNRFHWHITDSQAFPVEMRKWPNLTYFGAYNPSSIYSQEDVRQLVDYALVRGLQVIPEFDAPSHIGHGWEPEWTVPAGLGRLMLCFSKNITGAPIGYMNPANQKSYQVLNDIYSEFYNMSDQPDLIHIGGDEVSTRCWLNDKDVLQWMQDNNYTLNTTGAAMMWLDFEVKVQNIIKQISNNSAMPILWTSTLTRDYKRLLKEKLGTDNIIIEVWDSSDASTVPDLLDFGFKVIVSNSDGWYLDCGFGQWVSEANNWCSPYKYWQLMYNNRPYKSLYGKQAPNSLN